MPKKKDRLVPIRQVGKKDKKPRTLVPATILKVYAAKFGPIEWFDQAAHKWREVSINAE